MSDRRVAARGHEFMSACFLRLVSSVLQLLLFLCLSQRFLLLDSEFTIHELSRRRRREGFHGVLSEGVVYELHNRTRASLA